MKIDDFGGGDLTGQFQVASKEESNRLDKKLDKIFDILNSDEHHDDAMSLIPIMIANIYENLFMSKDLDEAKMNLKIMNEAVIEILEQGDWE